MKRIIIVLGVLVILFGFTSIDKSNDVSWDEPKVTIHTDKLGCTWAVVYSGRYDGGVHMVHHPTCKNINH